MRITASGLGKRFNRHWLFRDINFEFSKHTAIVGPNGSGKSTLVQLLSGYTLPSSGKIEWRFGETEIEEERQFEHFSVAAPYLELIEEFTLSEQIEFHFRFKQVREEKSVEELITIGYFDGDEEKMVKQFSSGMKQRLKLLLALYSEVPVVLLDEPTTNLDETGVAWYLQQVNTLNIPLIIVASNQPREYEFCDQLIDIQEFKT